MILSYSKIFLAIAFLLHNGEDVARWEKGRLVYANPLRDSLDVAAWVMEGPGETLFNDGWMEMYSPAKQWDHVFWCPEDFPSRFIAEWEVRNVNPAEGLLIVFFATTGLHGEDIFDKRLPARDGTFKFYTKDQLKSYHISYYTNNPKNPDRSLTHLRKNNSFALVQTGSEGIPKMSTDIHRIRLIKDDDHILFFVEDRKVIDWTDDGKTFGRVLGSGKIGFRQMRWSYFAYKNFKVWEIK